MTLTPERPQDDSINEQILASLTSGVLACDSEGVILRANRAAALHLGLGEDLLAPGKSLRGIGLMAPLMDLLTQVRTAQQPMSRMELSLTEGDSTRILGISASPLTENNQFTGAIFLFIDMTELRRLEHLARLNQQLAQIGELTAGVVHELRNPLSVVSGMAELLVRKVTGDEERKRARTIHEEAKHMSALIDQFLGFARPFTVHPAPVQGAAIMKRTAGLCENLARELGVTLETGSCPNDLLLEADLEKIAQALSNILRNGIEASGKGGRVRFTVSQMEGRAHFRVEDSGPGIQLGANEDLFNAFFTKKANGTGLGLSIAHRMVAAHAGQITYGNIAEGGAWFEVVLPLEQPARPGAGSAR